MAQKILYAGLFCWVVIVFMSANTGCANIIPPTGGPRDTLPPVLLYSAPKDSVTRFTGKQINLSFDEYVQLDNISENIIVSPTPNITPSIESKLRTISIKIRDTLEANTTYSINFGNAIRDVNEGNIFKQFTYVFSTGTFLDDKTLTGKVTLAETGKTDTTLLAMLYREEDDSAVVKKRPRYITRLDNKGNYAFHNLPAGKFFLFAIKDEGGARRYQSASQLFAFAGDPVLVSAKNEPVNLYAYVEQVEEPRKPSGTAGGGNTKEKKNEDKRLRYQTTLETGVQDVLDTLKITFAAPLRSFDSSKIIFTDEKFEPLSGYTWVRDSLNQKFTFLYRWKFGTAYNLILNKDVAEDSAGRKLIKIDTIAFKSKKEEEYGSIRLRFATLDLSKHPVLQLVQSDKVVYTHIFTAKEFYAKIFQPGDYELRILYDENGNGRWDPGAFFGRHRQPEKVRALETKINVKANFDKTFSITL